MRWTVAVSLLLAGCASEADVGMPPPNVGDFSITQYEEVGEGWLRGSVGVLRDKETGCKYIVVGYDDIRVTPRLGQDGKPMCGG